MKNVISGVLEASAGKCIFHYFRGSIKVPWNSELPVLSQTFLSISLIDLISNRQNFKELIYLEMHHQVIITQQVINPSDFLCYTYSYIINWYYKLHLGLIEIVVYIGFDFVKGSCKFSWPNASSWIFLFFFFSPVRWALYKLNDIIGLSHVN